MDGCCSDAWGHAWVFESLEMLDPTRGPLTSVPTRPTPTLSPQDTLSSVTYLLPLPLPLPPCLPWTLRAADRALDGNPESSGWKEVELLGAGP